MSVSIAIISLLPLWLLPITFFDGRILDYMMVTGDFRGLAPWLLESRWNLAYPLEIGIYHAAKLTSTSYLLWCAAVNSVAVIGISVEVFYYARRAFRIPAHYALLAAYLALLFPVWHVLSASIFMIFILCMWWLLLGYRLILIAKNFVVRYAGLIFILLSFQLNTNFSFLVGLCVAELLLELCFNNNISTKTWRENMGLISLSIIAFILLKHYFPPYGDYQNYNRIEMFDSLSNLVDAFWYIGRYLQWTMIVIIPCCVGYFIAIEIATIDRLIHEARSFPLRAAIVRLGYSFSNNYMMLLILLILFESASIPYVAVHKCAKLNSFYIWSYRNAFLLCAPLSLMGAWLSHFLVTSLRENIRSIKYAAIIPVTLCCGFAGLLYHGYSKVVERASFELGLIHTLQTIPQPPAGAVYLHYDNIHEINLFAHESNWLLWRAYGKLNWVTALDNDGSAQTMKQSSPTDKILASGDEPHRLEFLLPNFQYVSCYTDISLEGAPYKAMTAWAWLIGLAPLPVITITDETINCLK